MVEIFICPRCGGIEYHKICSIVIYYEPYISEEKDGGEYVEWDEKEGDIFDCEGYYCTNCNRDMHEFYVDDDFAVKLIRARGDERIDMMVKYIAEHYDPDTAYITPDDKEFISEALGIAKDDVEEFVKLVREFGDVRKAKVMLKLTK